MEKYHRQISVFATLSNVSSGIEWLNQQTFALVFSDILLACRTSLDIFTAMIITTPVILKTKFNEYVPEGVPDPSDFFRINRSCIININALKDVRVYSNSRLKIISPVAEEKALIVSREKAAPYKTWLEGKPF